MPSGIVSSQKLCVATSQVHAFLLLDKILGPFMLAELICSFVSSCLGRLKEILILELNCNSVSFLLAANKSRLACTFD